MKPFLLFAFFSLASFQLLQAQNYRTAAGVSLGAGIGLTVQQYLVDGFTLQTNLQRRTGRDQTNWLLLLEKHQKLISRRINIFAGGGTHMAWQNFQGAEGDSKNQRFGLAGVVGVEFNPGRLNLAWDFTPTLFVSGDGQALQTQTAISIRYVLIKRKKKKKKIWPFNKNRK